MRKLITAVMMLAMLGGWSSLSMAQEDGYLKTIKEFELQDHMGQMHTLDEYAAWQ